jgi:hypothetical protein
MELMNEWIHRKKNYKTNLNDIYRRDSLITIKFIDTLYLGVSVRWYWHSCLLEIFINNSKKKETTDICIFYGLIYV